MLACSQGLSETGKLFQAENSRRSDSVCEKKKDEMPAKTLPNHGDKFSAEVSETDNYDLDDRLSQHIWEVFE